MYQTGVVASIAITFVPQMTSSLKDIREAQAIRGHRFKGLRDLLPLFAPLLTSGLERSMQLAESMEARGFGEATREDGETRRLVHKALIPLALFALLAGVFLYGYLASLRWIGALLAVGAMLLLSANLFVMGRLVRRSHYSRELWRRRDTLVSAAAVASMAVMVGIWLFDADSLLFYPYPKFAFPTFNPLVGLALLAAVAPVLSAPQGGSADHDRVPAPDLYIS
jgi:energy-coupling factor transport system permease protein